MPVLRTLAAAAALIAAAAATQKPPAPSAADKAADKWVRSTLAAMSIDEKAGQLLVSSFPSSFISTDSNAFDELAKTARDYHVGGFHVFGATEAAPAVLLNPTYGTVILGQPLEAASTLNRLQALSKLPLLNTADFETGVGFRIQGATAFPRAMAFGAAGDERLAYEAGRVTGQEARAIGVHVNFAPVVDVNNNPRNPVINTRSFGADPALVGRLASAYVRGLQSAGVSATLKHFPGHGDTDVDSHIGLPIINQPRPRLDQIELPPFRDAIGAGAAAVMTGHIVMPALDATPSRPGTLSEPIVAGLLRTDLGFRGLVYTDSMGMQGVTAAHAPGAAAVLAIKAGNDIVLHSPNDGAAFAGLRDAVKSGEIPISRVDASVDRILRAKARAGLHRTRTVNLDAIAGVVGTRANQAIADEVSRRSITLVKDEGNQVPLKAPRDAQVLYLSVLDYPSGWRIAAPSRTFIPELRQRWPNVTAIELSDRSTASEIDLVRAIAPRFDAIVASIFVRAASGSGRQDLAAPLQALLARLAAQAASAKKPLIAVFFGNPYAAMYVRELPAMLLTYDFYDRAEASAVRAIAGEAAIGGKLPIPLPGLFDAGFGLMRSAVAAGSVQN